MGTTPTGEQGTEPPTTADRRRRPRLRGETVAWVLPPALRLPRHGAADEDGWEVLVRDVSRLGIGFESSDAMAVGSTHQIRIGRGPLSRARTIRVVCCRPTEFDTFGIGAEFVQVAERPMPRAA